jgi:hypothetical protein
MVIERAPSTLYDIATARCGTARETPQAARDAVIVPSSRPDLLGWHV